VLFRSLTDAAPAIPAAVWRGPLLALDMVYGARPTAFMRAALEAGCPRVEDGLGMLVGQAAESFALWRGVRPEAAPVLAALRARLAAAA
jgi:shikimate dehydrogenase